MGKKYADIKIGDVFGRWTVIGESDRVVKTKKGNRYYWTCQCDCHKQTVKEVREDQLKMGTSTSCGCNRINDLTGKSFGYLTVIAIDTTTKSDRNDSNKNRLYWKCKCKCGNETVVRQDTLMSGNVTSCGCLAHERENLIGQNFGELVVVSYHSICEYEGTSVVLWNCKCTCGNTVVCRAGNLKSGISTSCGCKSYISKSGEEIVKILKNNNISFQKEYRFDDCRYKNPLPFDFVIFGNNKDKNISTVIEYDGEFHYVPIRIGGITQKEAERNLEETQKRDKIKTEYCMKNNIKLIRIPYWERDNLEHLLFSELNKLGFIS